MATSSKSMRSLSCWKQILRQTRAVRQQQLRTLNTTPISISRFPGPPPPGLSRPRASQQDVSNRQPKKMKVYPPPPSARAVCKDPIAAVTESQLGKLDPTRARTRLFTRSNLDAAKVGDILLVRTKNGDDFAGVCLNIRRSGIDTAILLRNNLTRVGVEMWYKIYSPNVEGIEVVQRREKRARRARLYYMRKPKHDVGSVENIVRQYQRQRAMLRSADVKSRDANSTKKKNNKRGSNK
ncbi:hypothetical protein LTR50_001706 [Elasticomyces elasticus]|nr:hypothetical protein LTR50_001706 [Elasticomyces elasticus]